jgi:two-component system LytT family response regulator
MIKTVIIDDSTDAVLLTENILKNNFNDIQICAKAHTVLSGIKAILEHKPDLVLLDIDLKEGTGFDILESIPNRDFKIIFITAYNSYSLKAFKFSAVDYILKPVDEEELVHTISRLREAFILTENYQTLLQNIKTETPQKLAVPNKNGFTVY